MGGELKISARISTAKGDLELNDRQYYKLGANTMAQQQQTMRRQTIASPYIPGTFTVNAVPDSVTETVEVYVYGTDAGDMRIHLDMLLEAFTQFDYTITWDFHEDAYRWACEPSDYTIDTRREFRHSRMALVNFQVPRYPELFKV